MRSSKPHTSALVAILTAVGCSAGTTDDLPGFGGSKSSGGASNRGGNGQGGSSGAGTGPSAGGFTAPARGGSSGGFTTATGGTFSTGGQGKGGERSSLGGSASGGVQGSGGQGSGGFGRGGSGGTTTFGAGGKSFGAGGAASGGAAAGGRASGGNTATAGSGTGVPPTNCTEGNKTVSGNGTGKHCGYTYEYWKDSGSGSLTLTPTGFSVDWSGINNLLGRKGIRPGSGNLVVNYEANYQPNGNSYLCIYGWTRNPLVEYYIVDSWGTWRPPGGQGHVGTVSSDGGTYDIYKVPRTGPSIDGNGSFTQYFSVRTAKRTSGVITIGNHFTAWKNNGMPMGSFYEVSMTVEGYQSSGKADVKFSMQ